MNTGFWYWLGKQQAGLPLASSSLSLALLCFLKLSLGFFWVFYGSAAHYQSCVFVLYINMK